MIWLKAIFKGHWVDFIVIIAIISIFVHFWNPLKGLADSLGIFGTKTQQVKVEDTPEYKKQQQEKIDAQAKELAAEKKASYYQGMYDQQKADVQLILANNQQVQQKFVKSVKSIKNLKPAERDTQYQKEVKKMNEELKDGGAGSSGEGTNW